MLEVVRTRVRMLDGGVAVVAQSCDDFVGLMYDGSLPMVMVMERE